MKKQIKDIMQKYDPDSKKNRIWSSVAVGVSAAIGIPLVVTDLIFTGGSGMTILVGTHTLIPCTALPLIAYKKIKFKNEAQQEIKATIPIRNTLSIMEKKLAAAFKKASDHPNSPKFEKEFSCTKQDILTDVKTLSSEFTIVSGGIFDLSTTDFEFALKTEEDDLISLERAVLELQRKTKKPETLPQKCPKPRKGFGL